MANTANYAEVFREQLDQKYARESVTNGIDGVALSFAGANVVKLPSIAVPGYKNHSRAGGWNRQDVQNSWTPYKLEHDRDVEFFVDAEDVDETSQVLSAGNITNEFEETQGIPEWDMYTIGTIYSRVTDLATGVANKTFDALDETKPGEIIDKVTAKIEAMIEKSVPISGVQIRGKVNLIAFLKSIRDGDVTITGVDAIKIQVLKAHLQSMGELTHVPAERLFTEYNFSNGAVGVGGTGKKKVQLMFTHPKAIARVNKRDKIYLKSLDGTDGDEGDGYTYRNRKYWDVFVLKHKVDAIEFFTETLA